MNNTQVLHIDSADALAQLELGPFKSISLFDQDILFPEPSAEVLTDSREKRQPAGGVLRVMGVAELTAAQGGRFRRQVLGALNGHMSVEIDLAQTTTMDCAGLGSLIAIRNLTRQRKGVVRLLNPNSRVRQLLDLMRAGEIFEIVPTSG